MRCTMKLATPPLSHPKTATKYTDFNLAVQSGQMFDFKREKQCMQKLRRTLHVGQLRLMIDSVINGTSAIVMLLLEMMHRKLHCHKELQLEADLKNPLRIRKPREEAKVRHLKLECLL